MKGITSFRAAFSSTHILYLLLGPLGNGKIIPV